MKKLKFVRPGYEKINYFGLVYGTSYSISKIINPTSIALIDHKNEDMIVYVHPEWCENPYEIEIPEDLFQL